jgi:hypothetical protein
MKAYYYTTAAKCPFFVIVLLFTAFLNCVGQTAIKTEKQKPESAAKPQAAIHSGYLSKSATSGLRFASPPKPSVPSLPPLPITFDPQPVFAPEFAQPLTELTVQMAPPPPAASTPPAKPALTELVSSIANRQDKITALLVPVQAVSAQMLTKYFQDAKLTEVQAPVDSMVFRVPENAGKQTSSASYQVK